MKLSRYIGDKAFIRRTLAIVLPMVIQNGIAQFVNLLDNMMVGQVGTVQMGAVGIANQLVFVFNLTLFGAISGAGIFGAQYFGSDDQEGVRNTFRIKLLIAGVLTAVALVGILLFKDSLLSLYLTGEGTAEDRLATLDFAREYLLINLIGFIPFALSNVYASTLREGGATAVPMVASLLSVAVNLVGNALLIFGLLGLPRMGIAGAAVATVIARFVEVIYLVLWTHFSRRRMAFADGLFRTLRTPAGLLKRMLGKAVPLMLNEMLWSGGVALLNVCYSMHSLDVLPAITAASTITNVFNVAFIAMGNATGIILGQLLGADRMEEAVDTDRKLIAQSVLVGAFFGFLLALLSPVIPGIYRVSDNVRALASAFLLISGLVAPIQAMCNCMYFTLRCGGKVFITFLFDSGWQFCFTVPLAFLLTKVVGIGIIPLYAICQYSELGKALIGGHMIRKGLWLNNIVREDTAA